MAATVCNSENEPRSRFVFVSYSHKDHQQVTKIVDDLSKKLLHDNVQIWFDQSQPLDNIASGLADAIDQSAALVACLSHNYINSTWCGREFEYADKNGVPIVALVVQPGFTPPAAGSMSLILGHCKYITLSGDRPGDDYCIDQLVHRVRMLTTYSRSQSLPASSGGGGGSTGSLPQSLSNDELSSPRAHSAASSGGRRSSVSSHDSHSANIEALDVCSLDSSLNEGHHNCPSHEQLKSLVGRVSSQAECSRLVHDDKGLVHRLLGLLEAHGAHTREKISLSCRILGNIWMRVESCQRECTEKHTMDLLTALLHSDHRLLDNSLQESGHDASRISVQGSALFAISALTLDNVDAMRLAHKEGAVRQMVQLLHSSRDVEVKVNCCTALGNILMRHKPSRADCSSVPTVRALLALVREQGRKEALWALNALIVRNPVAKRICLQEGVLDTLAGVFEKNQCPECVSRACLTISSLVNPSDQLSQRVREELERLNVIGRLERIISANQTPAGMTSSHEDRIACSDQAMAQLRQRADTALKLVKSQNVQTIDEHDLE